MLSLAFKRRTSLDQTTLNQSVSVNGVHSDNDTSQVRHVSLDARTLNVFQCFYSEMQQSHSYQVFTVSLSL